MKKQTHWCFSFACNDPANGNFTGLVSHVQVTPNTYNIWNNWYLELEIVGQDLRFTLLDSYRFRFLRDAYVFKRAIPWYGNWCWEGFVLTRDEGKRLLNKMRDTGKFNCTEGSERIYNWFKKAEA